MARYNQPAITLSLGSVLGGELRVTRRNGF